MSEVIEKHRTPLLQEQLDARYSCPPMSEREIASRVEVKNPNTIFIAIRSVARGGITAMSRGIATGVLGPDGKPVYLVDNPFKSIMRAQVSAPDQRAKYTVPDVPVFVDREQYGFYTERESSLDVIHIYRALNIPIQNVRTFYNMRHPVDTWLSWVKFALHDNKYRKQLMENYILSVRECHKQYERDKLLGIQTTAMVYEAMRDNSPSIAMQRLIARLGLIYTDRVVQNWNDGEDPIHYIPYDLGIYTPTASDGTNLHDKAKTSTGLSYQTVSDEKVIQQIKDGNITREDLERLLDAKVEDTYNLHVLSASEDLGISINPTERIEYLLQSA